MSSKRRQSSFLYHGMPVDGINISESKHVFILIPKEVDRVVSNKAIKEKKKH